MPRDGYRAVGVIERPRGLNGELKVRPLTDFPQRFAPGARVFIAARPRRVERANWHSNRLYLYIDGLRDRESAERLRGELIEVPMDERPHSDEPFWYIDEIEGLPVVELDGRQLGTVREVLQTGANDVYIVDRGAPPDLLVPAVTDVIVAIDPSAGLITVDLPDGLMPDQPSPD